MRTRRNFHFGSADWSASRRWQGRNIAHREPKTLRLTGAAGVTSVTPLFTFPTGSIEVYRNGVYVTSLTSGVEATGGSAIALDPGDTLEYRCSDWDAITRIEIHNDKVSGAFPATAWPSGLQIFRCYNTGVTGDISIEHWPSGLQVLSCNNTGVTGDVSSEHWPSGLQILSYDSTGVTGDVSTGTWPSGLQYFYCHNTSVTYGTGGAFSGVTSSLVKIDADDCGWDENEVDRALSDLVASGVTGKAFDAAGSNDAPTAAGEADKTTLVTGRGWTVSTTAP